KPPKLEYPIGAALFRLTPYDVAFLRLRQRYGKLDPARAAAEPKRYPDLLLHPKDLALAAGTQLSSWMQVIRVTRAQAEIADRLGIAAESAEVLANPSGYVTLLGTRYDARAITLANLRPLADSF